MSDYWIGPDGRVHGRTVVQSSQVHESVFDNAEITSPGLPPQPVLAMSEVVDLVKEVLAQTEIVHLGRGHDVVFTPDGGWDLHGAPEDMVFTRVEGSRSVQWEVQCSEETFWGLCVQFLGRNAVVEMKHDLEDMLRWEGEGGSWLS